MYYSFVLLFEEKKTSKTTNVELFSIHFYNSDIFLHFSQGLSFVDDNSIHILCGSVNDNSTDILCGSNFMDMNFLIFCVTYIFWERPKSAKSAKYNLHRN